MKLKHISAAAVPRALALAERYRLLNEPEQAMSIYQDVLATDPNNEEATKNLFLCVTEQFGGKHGPGLEVAEELAKKMSNEFERQYYLGVACERWARSRMHEGAHASFVGSWIKKAMAHYEKAEALSPADNENAVLRWNACARLLARVPGLAEEHDASFGVLED